MSQWVRLWEDMPTDPKWRAVAIRSGRPVGEVIAVFVHMMKNAGAWDHWGFLKNWNDEDIAAALDFKPEHVTIIRESMQGKTLDGDHLSGWENRQTRSSDQSAERTAEWRKRKRNEAIKCVTVGDGHVTVGDGCVTAGDAEEKRIEEDRNLSKKKDSSPNPQTRIAEITLKAEFEEEFWPANPHKVGKRGALKAFLAARKRCELAPMMAGLAAYVRDKPPERDWCNPATWLNQDRWLDQPAPNGHDPSPIVTDTTAAHVAYWRQEGVSEERISELKAKLNGRNN